MTSQAITAPKTKFSFKNKKLTTGSHPAVLTKPTQRSHLFTTLPSSASDVDSTTTSRSTTPLHLQDAEDGNLQSRKPIPPMAPPSSHLSTSEYDENILQGRQTGADTPMNVEQQALQVKSRRGRYLTLEDLKQGSPRVSPQGNKPVDEESPASQGCVVSQTSQSIINLGKTFAKTGDELSSSTLTALDAVLLLAPAVIGPVHITNVQRSTLVLSCRQFRMHDSHNVDIYMHCTSRPIIEDCSGIRFAPLPAQFANSIFSQVKNMYDQVDDFKWLRAEASPNWQVLPQEKRIGEDIWVDVLQTVKKLDSKHSIEIPDAVSTVASVLNKLGIESSI